MRRLTVLAALVALVGLAGCTTTTTTSTGGGEVITTTKRVDGKPTEAEARNRARARSDLAAGYLRNGQLAVALDEARRAVSIDPNYADAYGLLGLIYMGLGENPQAEDNFVRSLKLDPASPDLNNNYGWFLCQTGREQQSIEYFQRALRDPLYATPAKANQNAGTCYAQMKDYASAETYLRKAFELDASNAGTKYQLTRLYLATGQTEKAAFYYGLLNKVTQPSPATLWLGIKVARAEGNIRVESQLAAELRQRFPQSPEASALARGAFNE